MNLSDLIDKIAELCDREELDKRDFLAIANSIADAIDEIQAEA